MYSVLQGASLFLPSASSPSAQQSIDWNQKTGLFEPGRGERGFGQLCVLGGFSLRSFLGDSENIFLPFNNMGQKSACFIYMISSGAHFYRMSHQQTGLTQDWLKGCLVNQNAVSQKGTLLFSHSHGAHLCRVEVK